MEEFDKKVMEEARKDKGNWIFGLVVLIIFFFGVFFVGRLIIQLIIIFIDSIKAVL